jgi:hypothetical protein
MVTAAQRKDRSYASYTAYLLDPQWEKHNRMKPTFGFMTQGASQAEADYDRLVQITTSLNIPGAGAARQQFEDNALLDRAFGKPTPEVFAARVSDWMNNAPTASPGLITALSQYGIGMDAPGVQEALAADAAAQHQADSNAQPVAGSAANADAEENWLQSLLGNTVAPVTRNLLDTLVAPLQAVQGGMSGAAGALGILGAEPNEGGPDWGEALQQIGGILPPVAGIIEATGGYEGPNPWEQTNAGQSLLDFVGLPSGTTTGEEVTPGAFTVNQGTGYLTADPESGVGLAQRQATYESARTKFNDSWTLGRGIFSIAASSPDDTMYKFMSGLTDAAVSIFMDPTLIAGKISKTAMAAKAARETVAANRAVEPAVQALRTAEAETLLKAEQKAAEQAALNELIKADEKAARRWTPEEIEEAQSLLDDYDDLMSGREAAQRSVDDFNMSETEARAGAAGANSERHYNLSLQRQELEDLLLITRQRQAANEARRTMRGKIAVDEPTAAVINGLHKEHGVQGTEDIFARLSGDAGAVNESTIGGVFTDDVLPIASRTKKTKYQPAFSEGGEVVAGLPTRVAPTLVDQAATLTKKEAEALYAKFEEVGLLDRPRGWKTVATPRKDAIRGMKELLLNPKIVPTWGHVFSLANSTGSTKVLAEALTRAGVDGITDIRKVLGTGDGGVWWGNALDVRALPAEAGVVMAREALPMIQQDARALKAQIKDIDQQMAAMTQEAKARVQAAFDLHEAQVKVTTTNRLNESKALREQMLAEAGVVVRPDFTKFIDYEAAYNFVFGGAGKFSKRNHAEKSLQALMDIEDPLTIMRLTGWDAATSRAVATAKTKEEVMAGVAKEMGLGVDHQSGRISTTIAYKRTVAAEQKRFWRAFNSLGAKARWATTSVPFAQRINFSDADDMVGKIDNYLRYFGMSQDKIDPFLRRIIMETDEHAQRNNVIDAFNALEEHLIERIAKRKTISEGGKQRLRDLAQDSTKVYANAAKHEYKYYQERLAMRGWAGHILSDGEAVFLPNAHIEGEFARGGVALPDPRELVSALGRITGVFDQLPTREVTEWLAKVSTDWWRTAMLVRGAYIVRNLAEEQIRVFLSGHDSYFNHPLRAAAVTMSLKADRSPAVARVLQAFKTYDEGIDGTKFLRPEHDEMVSDLTDSFNDLMLDTSSLLDNRVYNMSRGHGYRLVSKAEDGFSTGWANELNRLRGSQTVGLVMGRFGDTKATESLEQMWIASGRISAQRDEIVMQWLFDHPDGAVFRDRLGKASPQMKQIMGDVQGTRDYLFGPVGSVRARVNEATMGMPKIQEYVRTGVLRGKNNEILHDAVVSRRAKTKPLSEDRLERLLRNHHTTDIPESANPSFPTPFNNNKVFTEDPTIVDKFFSFSGRMERTGALGPEWKYAYWDEIASKVGLLDAKGLEKARVQARKVLPRNHPALKALKDADGKGTLTADDLHVFASNRAGKHVKDLFYDARDRNAVWHATRLVFPFGQAWADTMQTWLTLAAKNPMQVHKAGKALVALQERGSNTVYDVGNALDPFGDVEYDANQGFFFEDPNTQQMKFNYPMFATPLAGIMASTQDAKMTMTGSATGLNLAFSGDNPLPGFGPVAAAVVGASGLTDRPGALADTLTMSAYPYGEPDPDTALIDTIVPAWAKYTILGGLMPGGGEQWRRQQEKGALIATASRHDYGDLTDPANQERWFEDANGLARIASIIRGFGTFMLPTSPQSNWVMKDKTGNWLPIASVSSQYFDTVSEQGPDQAIIALANQYGEKGLAAIIPMTTGDRGLSGAAYTYLKAHPEIPQSQYDAVALMFPGDPSPASLAWQRTSGYRRNLSWQEKQDKAYGLLYRLQLAEVYRAAEEHGWSPEQIQAGKDAVLDRFGGVVPSGSFDPNFTQNGMANLRNLLDTPAGASMPNAATALSILNTYDAAVEDYRRAKNDPRATLKGKNAAMWREEVLRQVNALVAESPQSMEVAALVRNAMGED